MVIILGAGLAGLSAAYHLRGRSYAIYEKEDRVGGLCRSFSNGGFTFDLTGHLLHFRKESVRRLVCTLLGDQLESHARRSYIFSNGVYTDYPFQANTHGLPKAVVKECLLGFIQAYVENRIRPSALRRCRNMEEWILKAFGRGIGRHFMIPFNEKLWQRRLRDLSADWGGGWLIPQPALEEVVQGALGISNQKLGYNPQFLYPKAGGIQTLPSAFVGHVRNLHLKTALVRIDPEDRQVYLSTGERVGYRHLVSTLPLPELVKRCAGAPREVRAAAARLKYISVYNINLGINREKISEAHWIYLPEKNFPFYRVGFPTNFSKAVAPPGCSSLYVEISHRRANRIESSRLLDQVMDGLQKLGVLRPSDTPLVSEVRDIPYAYVVFDKNRATALTVIQKYLRSRGIHSIGRYGAWEHTSMEDAIWQGQQVARIIKGRSR